VHSVITVIHRCMHYAMIGQQTLSHGHSDTAYVRGSVCSKLLADTLVAHMLQHCTIHNKIVALWQHYYYSLLCRCVCISTVVTCDSLVHVK
jgi:hypothetical protein